MKHNRIDSCLKIKGLGYGYAGFFKPDKRYCKNNCNKKGCEFNA